MLLTITTTYTPATDLGYLLAKNPARTHSFELAFGRTHVFYPEADEQRCTAALLLDIDPVGLVRGRGERGGLLDQYVNDRPYVASSFLSVAIAEAFGSALNGRSRARPELAASPIPLEASIPALPTRGGADVVRRLFAPLGYALEISEHPLDPQFPEWGASRVVSLTLRGTVRLADLLTHLYVLIPVLDATKHYYFGEDEIEKLLRRGEGWLALHPERELITGRYLKRRPLVRAALERLVAEEPVAVEEASEEAAEPSPADERRQSLHDQRLTAIGVPEAEWNRASAIVDPEGRGPRIYFQQVPEPKVVKNRVHLDVNVGGGPGISTDERRTRVDAAIERLCDLGATKLRPYEENGEYWVVMQDPEGNEFCLQ